MKVFLSLGMLIFSCHSMAVSIQSRAKFKAQLGFGITNVSATTKATDDTTTASSTQFTQIEIRPTLIFFPTTRLAMAIYYFQTSLGDYSTSGFGANGRWYYLGRGTIEESFIDNKKISMTPTFAPYVEFGIKQQSFEAETINIKYSGFEVGLGTDWHLKNSYYLNFALQIGSLASGASRTVLSQSLLVAVGRAF